MLAVVTYFRRDGFLLLVGAVLLFFAGTLAKETAIMVLPGFLAMGWVAFKERVRPGLSLGKAWLPALGAFVALAGYAILRSNALRSGDLGAQHLVHVVKGA